MSVRAGHFLNAGTAGTFLANSCEPELLHPVRVSLGSIKGGNGFVIFDALCLKSAQAEPRWLFVCIHDKQRFIGVETLLITDLMAHESEGKD